MSSKHHGTKVNEIFETKDYHKFNFIKTNRDIHPTHLKNLIKNMKEKGWLPGSYMVVDRNFFVIDGQHRLKAAAELGIAVRYVMEKAANEDTMHNLNKDQKKWNIMNHIDQFMKKNNTNYIHLHEFMTQFPCFKPTEAMMFCKNKFVRVSAQEFENGLFKVNDMKVASKWAEKIASLKPLIPFYNRGFFVRAVITCMSKPGFKLDEFIKKVNLRPKLMVNCGSVDQFIEVIENVYNHYRTDKEKINLRF